MRTTPTRSQARNANKKLKYRRPYNKLLRFMVQLLEALRQGTGDRVREGYSFRRRRAGRCGPLRAEEAPKLSGLSEARGRQERPVNREPREPRPLILTALSKGWVPATKLNSSVVKMAGALLAACAAGTAWDLDMLVLVQAPLQALEEGAPQPQSQCLSGGAARATCVAEGCARACSLAASSLTPAPGPVPRVGTWRVQSSGFFRGQSLPVRVRASLSA